jgi:hypothetical protein
MLLGLWVAIGALVASAPGVQAEEGRALHVTDDTARRRDVAYWHESEVPALHAYVGYRGHSGKHLLAVRFSQFDPRADSCHRDMLRCRLQVLIRCQRLSLGRDWCVQLR